MRLDDPRLPVAVLALAAAALLTLAVALGVRSWTNFQPQDPAPRWRAATGTTVSAQTMTDPGTTGALPRTSYSPIIAYTARTADGTLPRTLIGAPTQTPPEIGETFRIGYDPASRFESATILRGPRVVAGSVYAASGLLSVLGALVAAAVSVRLLRRRV